jgi:hypothetical protein
MTGMPTRNIDISDALAATITRPNAPAAQLKARREALSLFKEEDLAVPVFSYQIVPVLEMFGEMLSLEHGVLRAPGLTDRFTGLVSIAAVVCSLGSALEKRVSALFAERKYSLALALDEIGTELLFHTDFQASTIIRDDAHRQGMTTSIEMNAGSSGLPLDQQPLVVSLSGGERHGVAVNEQGMLFPVKSLSMVIGIGANFPSQGASKRCDNCSSRKQCRIQMH